MPKKRFNRKQRVNDLIQTELAAIIQREAKDLHVGMVTVTGVEVAHDLSHARVFVSVLEDDKVKETIDALNTATKFIRYNLANAVELRITPELKFVYDDSTVRGNRISSLINDALKNVPSDDNKK
jgi:ribosome-binding factor A